MKERYKTFFIRDLKHFYVNETFSINAFFIPRQDRKVTKHILKYNFLRNDLYNNEFFYILLYLP